MPQDHDFKRLVRARMAHTGERYTQARAALAAQRDAGDQLVSDRTRSLLGQLADTGLAAASRDHLARLPEPERRAAAIEGLRHGNWRVRRTCAQLLDRVDLTPESVAALTRMRFGRPDASLCVNGWTGGLVASSAACAFVDPISAVITGAIAGVLVTLSVEWLDSRLGVDDPAGSISVHAVGGLWGLLALGIFARIPRDWVLNGVAGGNSNQWLAQLAGVVTLVAFVLPLTFSLNWLLNRFYPQRVPAEGEPHGLDLYELGAGAYPEFVIHREDFRPR